MKNYLLFLITNFLLLSLGSAQGPSLANPIVNPAPTDVTPNGTTICVSFFNNSTTGIPYNDQDPVVITINTDQLSFNIGTMPVAPNVTWFTWTVDCNNNCEDPNLVTYEIVGIQNQAIPGIVFPVSVGGSICITGTASITPISTSTSGVGFNSNIAASSVNDIRPEASSNNQSTYTTASISLPIKLTDFKVKKEGETSLLQWKTAQADNFSHFEVERAGVDGNFVNIGQVNYPALDDRSNEKDFSFVDPTPLDGDNYYRLKLMDLDNSFEFSDIKTINFNAASLEVFPNPVAKGNSLQVKTNKVLGKIQIVDANGKLVRQVNHSGGELNIQTENMVTGMYYIKQGDSKELLPFIVVE